jgi:putative FmdB family regulatory protein
VPTYQYVCTDCGEALEVQQSFTDDSLTTCPTCTGRLRKVFNAVGVVFKGSGFYRNDSRAPHPESNGGSNGESQSSSDGGGSTEKATTDAKGSSDPKSGDSKGSEKASTKSDAGSTSKSGAGTSSGSAKPSAPTGSAA